MVMSEISYSKYQTAILQVCYVVRVHEVIWNLPAIFLHFSF